jgi:hypothetical protein
MKLLGLQLAVFIGKYFDAKRLWSAAPPCRFDSTFHCLKVKAVQGHRSPRMLRIKFLKFLNVKLLSPTVLLMTILGIAYTLKGAEATEMKANVVLFSDDFENGISKQWKLVRNVKVIEENGNHFARMEVNDALLNAPPAKINTPDSYKSEDISRWTNYELSFRFRVGNPKAPEGNAHSGNVLTISWNIAPSKENLYESRGFSVCNWLPNQTWFGNGPYINWYGKNEKFGDKCLKYGIFEFSAKRPEVTADWQTLKIRQQDGNSKIFFNDQLVFDGADMRADAGGFALKTTLSKNYNPKYVDIDDVKAVNLSGQDK